MVYPTNTVTTWLENISGEVSAFKIFVYGILPLFELQGDKGDRLQLPLHTHFIVVVATNVLG